MRRGPPVVCLEDDGVVRIPSRPRSGRPRSRSPGGSDGYASGMARTYRTRLAAVAAALLLGLAGVGCSDNPEGSEGSDAGDGTEDVPVVGEDRGEDGRQNPSGADTGGGSGVPSDSGTGGIDPGGGDQQQDDGSGDGK